jgi:hypothetical protein
MIMNAFYALLKSKKTKKWRFYFTAKVVLSTLVEYPANVTVAVML